MPPTRATPTSIPLVPRPARGRRAPARTAGLALLDLGGEVFESALPGVAGDDILLFAQLNTLSQMLDAIFARELRPHGLVYSEYRVLSVLRIRDRAAPLTPMALNGFVQLTPAGLTRALDRLEAAGHVRRVPNPDDRRSVQVTLTDSGWDFAEKVVRALADCYAELLADFSSEEREGITSETRRLIDRLSSHLGQ